MPLPGCWGDLQPGNTNRHRQEVAPMSSSLQLEAWGKDTQQDKNAFLAPAHSWRKKKKKDNLFLTLMSTTAAEFTGRRFSSLCSGEEVPLSQSLRAVPHFPLQLTQRGCPEECFHLGNTRGINQNNSTGASLTDI